MGRNWNIREAMKPGALEWCEAEQTARVSDYFAPDFRYRCRTCGNPYADDATFAQFEALRRPGVSRAMRAVGS